MVKMNWVKAKPLKASTDTNRTRYLEYRADRYLQAVDANNGHIANKRKGVYNRNVKGESK